MSCGLELPLIAGLWSIVAVFRDQPRPVVLTKGLVLGGGRREVLLFAGGSFSGRLGRRQMPELVLFVTTNLFLLLSRPYFALGQHRRLDWGLFFKREDLFRPSMGTL